MIGDEEVFDLDDNDEPEGTPATAASVDDAARILLERRQSAYKAVFGDPDNEAVRIVMDDLVRFCRAFESTFHADPRLAANADGRREVFLRINEHVVLPLDALLRRYHSGH